MLEAYLKTRLKNGEFLQARSVSDNVRPCLPIKEGVDSKGNEVTDVDNKLARESMLVNSSFDLDEGQDAPSLNGSDEAQRNEENIESDKED